jgi:hypothetical protein
VKNYCALGPLLAGPTGAGLPAPEWNRGGAPHGTGWQCRPNSRRAGGTGGGETGLGGGRWGEEPNLGVGAGKKLTGQCSPRWWRLKDGVDSSDQRSRCSVAGSGSCLALPHSLGRRAWGRTTAGGVVRRRGASCGGGSFSGALGVARPMPWGQPPHQGLEAGLESIAPAHAHPSCSSTAARRCVESREVGGLTWRSAARRGKQNDFGLNDERIGASWSSGRRMVTIHGVARATGKSG